MRFQGKLPCAAFFRCLWEKGKGGDRGVEGGSDLSLRGGSPIRKSIGYPGRHGPGRKGAQIALTLRGGDGGIAGNNRERLVREGKDKTLHRSTRKGSVGGVFLSA